MREVQRARLWAQHLYGHPGDVCGEASLWEMVQSHTVLQVSDGVLDLGVSAVVGLQSKGGAPGGIGSALAQPRHQHIAGSGSNGQQWVITPLSSIDVMARSLFRQPVGLAYGGVKADRQRAPLRHHLEEKADFQGQPLDPRLASAAPTLAHSQTQPNLETTHPRPSKPFAYPLSAEEPIADRGIYWPKDALNRRCRAGDTRGRCVISDSVTCRRSYSGSSPCPASRMQSTAEADSITVSDDAGEQGGVLKHVLQCVEIARSRMAAPHADPVPQLDQH